MVADVLSVKARPIGEALERRDVFITFDSTDTAELAKELLNGELGIVAQFAWPSRPGVQQRPWNGNSR